MLKIMLQQLMNKKDENEIYMCVCVFMYVYMYICISHKSNLTRWGDTAENLELDK